MSMPRYAPSAAVLLMCAGCPSPSLAADTPRTLTTSFEYTATANAHPGSPPVNLWIPVPSNGPLQRVRALKVLSPLPYRITVEPEYGNRMVYVHADHPNRDLTVTVQFTVDRRAPASTPGGTETTAAADRRRHLPARLTAPDHLVPVGGRYLLMAKDITEGRSTAQQKMRAIFDQTVMNMQYDYKKESPRYAQGDVAFVCDYKKGNCSDLHSYVTSLARSLGIPAFIEYGFPITGVPVPADPASAGAVGGYHCWTWFYDPGRGWEPLDASDARRWLDANRNDVEDSLFGGLVLERSAVAISRGRDIRLSPSQRGSRLNNFIYPYAEAGGAATPVTWDVRYELPHGTTAAMH